MGKALREAYLGVRDDTVFLEIRKQVVSVNSAIVISKLLVCDACLFVEQSRYPNHWLETHGYQQICGTFGCRRYEVQLGTLYCRLCQLAFLDCGVNNGVTRSAEISLKVAMFRLAVLGKVQAGLLTKISCNTASDCCSEKWRTTTVPLCKYELCSKATPCTSSQPFIDLLTGMA